MKSVNDYPPKIVFEWVLTMNNNEEKVLTENQYEFYKDNWRDGKIFFGEMEINPSFVSYADKRPADVIKNRYPCTRCHQGGHDPDDRSFWCKECGGSGTNVPENKDE